MTRGTHLIRRPFFDSPHRRWKARSGPGEVIATVYAERMLSGYAEITGRHDWAEREEAWRQGMGIFTTSMDKAVAAGMPRDVVPSKRGQILGGVLLALEDPNVVDTFRKEVSQTVAELGQQRSWFQALGSTEALGPRRALPAGERGGSCASADGCRESPGSRCPFGVTAPRTPR